MRRREFISFIGAGTMLPLSARAQRSTKVYRIAILEPLLARADEVIERDGASSSVAGGAVASPFVRLAQHTRR